MRCTGGSGRRSTPSKAGPTTLPGSRVMPRPAWARFSADGACSVRTAARGAKPAAAQAASSTSARPLGGVKWTQSRSARSATRTVVPVPGSWVPGAAARTNSSAPISRTGPSQPGGVGPTARSAWPASIAAIRSLVCRNSTSRTCTSRDWIWWDRPGWLTCRRAAAVVNEPSSTTATKYSSWRRETDMHVAYRLEIFYLLDIYRRRRQAAAMTSSPAAHSPDLRMLCLHGYHGSGAILRRQMAPLAEAIPASVELVYVDAPSLAEGDFGWWHEGFRGWERTRGWAVDLLRTGPRIDGLFGFSHGAALTGLLAGLRDCDPSIPQFQFAIMVGGFTSTMAHTRLFRHKLTVPPAPGPGRAAVTIPRRAPLLPPGRFADPLIIEPPGGHVIPGEPAV